MDYTMKKKIITLSGFISLIISLFISSAAAQVPVRQEDIPLYPGAVKIDTADVLANIRGKFIREEFADKTLASRSLKTYYVINTRKEIENGDLFKFYLSKLGGTRFHRNFTVPVNPPNKVYYNSEPEGVYFIWYVKETNGDLTRLSVTLPPGMGTEDSKYKMSIAIMSETYTDNENIKTKVPGDKELHWPIYPGATYEPRESAEGSIIASVYIFYSGDLWEKVISYYEKSLGTKPLKGEPSPGNTNYYFQRKPGPSYESDMILIEQEHNKTGSAKIKITYTILSR
jgi:hypothetical protein